MTGELSPESRLLQAEKESIALRAASVGHDVNNILQVIIGFGLLSTSGMTEDDPMRANMNHIIAAAARASNLTRSLLNLGRKLAIVPQTVDVHDMLSNVRSFLGIIVGEEIRLEISCAADPLKVSGDSAELEQVLINLASNARHAMPLGGTLSIVTEPVRIDPEFIGRHGFGKPGFYALISVTDDGTGMERATARRVFEPFFTTGNGSGLGLSTAYRIITEHNGFITVSSEPDQGSVFRIYLPLTGPAERAPLDGPGRKGSLRPPAHHRGRCCRVIGGYPGAFNHTHTSESLQ
ncbi:MAG: hypothetical protein A2075_04640 [Geobacteraceae bacterium GWC2_58_44]|nr:MAG: hypothetical protein A2075_04640 [Geobacteraceae bacterium GWC2_58_44]